MASHDCNSGLATAAFVAFLAVSASAAAPPEFSRDILPLLAKRCGKCHSGNAPKSGLNLVSSAGLLQGGDSGPAIVVGSSAKSLLFERIRAEEMPPDEPLSETQIELIRDWLDRGSVSNGTAPTTMTASPPLSVTAEVMTRVFFTHCISCHGKHKQEGGLDLRTPDAMRRGGKSGPAIVAGEPETSLIYRRLVADEMPPRTSVLGDSNYVRRVSPDEIELVREWIASGAPNALPLQTARPTKLEASDHWAFQPIRRPTTPSVNSADPVRTPIDAFILDRLESRGIALSPPAAKLELMRRVYFDLTGLPPSPAEVTEYLADEGEDAYERLVERLLASRHYGERWAQHWLDAAGYAESHGKIDRDQIRPYMWRYRDYVIRSLNKDKPYDRFLMEQLAGDELIIAEAERDPAKLIEALIATGFLLTASDATDEAAFNFVPHRMGVIAEQIDILSTAVMGLTMECARCHNHKFDPISQSDYYRFSAIFQSALDPYDWRIASHVYYPSRIPLERFYQRYIFHPDDTEPPELERFNEPLRAKVADLRAQLESKANAARERLRTAGDMAAAKLSVEQLAERLTEFKQDLEKLRSEIAALESRIITPGVIQGLRDIGGEPTPVFQLRRGDPSSPGVQVQPGIPSSLEQVAGDYRVNHSICESTSGNRLALARWLTSPDNPLTARVIVNRVWQQHFGRGIVSTPGNFGAKGALPSHPELLDWLANDLMENGWSLKRLHRLIVTSSVYRQTSRINETQVNADPDNVLLSRFPLRRLDGEAIREAILAISGRLDTTPFGPPGELERTPEGQVRTATSVEQKERRSIYLLKKRMRPLTFLEQFDGPEMVPNCLARAQSTVATQALQLYNSQFVREAARSFAERVMEEPTMPVESRIESVFLTALSRPPHEKELRQAVEDIARLRDAWSADQAADTAKQLDPFIAEKRAIEVFCLAVFNSPEFIFID